MPPFKSALDPAVLQAPPPLAHFASPKLATSPSGRRPKHLAIILDGNGRWATAKGLPRAAGDVKGVEAVRETIAGCVERKIEILSLYAFSVFNWRRPAEEVGGLMELFHHYLTAESSRLKNMGVRLRL